MGSHEYLNHSVDQIQTEGRNSWNKSVCGNLPVFFQQQIYSDVVLELGIDQIKAHRIILDINSDIMKNCASWQDPQTYLHHVIIDQQEFKESPDTVRDIVQSFYTGVSHVTEGNFHVIHKFAKVFKVTWLLRLAESIFKELLNPDNFVTLFKYAQRFAQESNVLVEVCLQRLDEPFLELLYRNGTFYNLDFYCLKSITSQRTSAIGSYKTFKMVTEWAEHDLMDRRCHVEVLLFHIKYHRIPKSDLVSGVFHWVSAAESIDDSIKVKLMKLIDKRIREGDIRENFLTDMQGSLGVSELGLDRYLEAMVKATKDKADKSVGYANLPSEIVLSVAKRRLQMSPPYEKSCILEYINDHCIISIKNVTEFLKIFDVTREMGLRILIQKFLTFSNLTSVNWEVLPSDVLRIFLHGLGTSDKEFIKLECIMRWGEANLTKTIELSDLVKTLVCYHKIPEDYINKILKPYLRRILSQKKISLSCGLHPEDAIEHCEEIDLMCCYESISDEFKLLRNAHQRLEPCNLYLQLQYDKPHPLTVSDELMTYDNIYMVEEQPFILFDTHKTLKKYPLNEKSSLDLDQLRAIFATYKNLCVMVIYSSKMKVTERKPSCPIKPPPLPSRGPKRPLRSSYRTNFSVTQSSPVIVRRTKTVSSDYPSPLELGLEDVRVGTVEGEYSDLPTILD